MSMLNKSQLRKIIKEEIKKFINEADYSVDNIKITVYEDVKEIDISSGPGKKITVKTSQVNRLIDKLREVMNNYRKNNMTFPKD